MDTPRYSEDEQQLITAIIARHLRLAPLVSAIEAAACRPGQAGSRTRLLEEFGP